MTYPPQPPGPQVPYGQPGQPPHWGPPGPQGGGFPPSGPLLQQQPAGFPGQTQQFGQPGPYGQRPGYPAYPAYPGQPGYPGHPGFPGGPGGEPPKKKTGLIVTLSIIGVLLIGGAVFLIIWLTGDDTNQQAQNPQDRQQGGQTSQQAPTPNNDPTEPTGQEPAPAGDDKAAIEDLGRKVLVVYREKDFELAREIACNPAGVNEDEFPDGVTDAEVDGEPTIDGDEAEIPITLELQGGRTQSGSIPVKKQDGAWCVGG